MVDALVQDDGIGNVFSPEKTRIMHGARFGRWCVTLGNTYSYCLYCCKNETKEVAGQLNLIGTDQDGDDGLGFFSGFWGLCSGAGDRPGGASASVVNAFATPMGGTD